MPGPNHKQFKLKFQHLSPKANLGFLLFHGRKLLHKTAAIHGTFTALSTATRRAKYRPTFFATIKNFSLSAC